MSTLIYCLSDKITNVFRAQLADTPISFSATDTENLVSAVLSNNADFLLIQIQSDPAGYREKLMQLYMAGAKVHIIIFHIGKAYQLASSFDPVPADKDFCDAKDTIFLHSGYKIFQGSERVCLSKAGLRRVADTAALVRVTHGIDLLKARLELLDELFIRCHAEGEHNDIGVDRNISAVGKTLRGEAVLVHGHKLVIRQEFDSARDEYLHHLVENFVNESRPDVDHVYHGHAGAVLGQDLRDLKPSHAGADNGDLFSGGNAYPFLLRPAR